MVTIIDLFMDLLDDDDFDFFINHINNFELVLDQLLNQNNDYYTIKLDSDEELINDELINEEEYYADNERNYKYECIDDIHEYGFGYGCRNYYHNDDSDNESEGDGIYNGMDWEDYYSSIYD
jgi:hypothetical protein